MLWHATLRVIGTICDVSPLKAKVREVGGNVFSSPFNARQMNVDSFVTTRTVEITRQGYCHAPATTTKIEHSRCGAQPAQVSKVIEEFLSGCAKKLFIVRATRVTHEFGRRH